MGLITFTDIHVSQITPSRLFKASVLDSHNLIPKLLPQAIKSIDIIQGDGGAGSIKQINFVGGGSFGYLKHQIDELNDKIYTYSYSLIEGEGLTEKIEKLSYKVKFESSPDGGTISTITTNCYTKGDVELKEEHIKAREEKVLGMFKVVEAYLIQNPDAYA